MANYRKGKDKILADILEISPLKNVENEMVSISTQGIETIKNSLALSEKKDEEGRDQKLIKPESPNLESQNSALKKILKNLTDKEEK